MDRTISNINSLLKTTNTEINVIKTRILQAKKVKQQYKWIIKANKKYKSIEKLNEKKKHIENKIICLEIEIDSALKLKKEIKEKKEMIKDWKVLKKKYKELELKSYENITLNHTINTIKSYKNIINKPIPNKTANIGPINTKPLVSIRIRYPWTFSTLISVSAIFSKTTFP